MRILLVAQWFDPEPTFKGLRFAHELQRLGHEVQVLTGFPNYPGGRVYEGYRIGPWRRELVEGVEVVRSPLYPSHDGSGVRRAANYLSFALSAAVAVPFLRRPDVAYVYHPPATVALPALVLRLLRGVPFVYDVQDLWPDTLAATGMVAQGGVLTWVGRAMSSIYARAHHVVVLSEGFRRRLLAQGVAEDRVSVIPNWTYEDPLPAPAAPPPDAPFTVMFAGTMGAAQDLGTVLRAAELMRDDPDVVFVMVGDGIEGDAVRARAEQARLVNVRFLPRRPASEMGELLVAADALLVHLKDDPLFEITIPSKTQAYLRAGRPVLMGVRGDAAELVRRAGAGLTFAPGDADALAEAVRTLRATPQDERAAMGARGARYYDQHLSLRAGASSFEVLLTRAARSRHRYERTKRVVDVVGAASGLVLGALPMAAVALLVRSRLGRPVVFRQERPGRNGSTFTMLKFRTMTDGRGPDGELLPDSERLTRLGSLLRSTSLDELPELVNVLRGDMSLVGPRPLLMRYSEFFTATEARRLEVRPGITGLAQVRGRNLVSWDERLAWDVRYVERISPWLDLRIIAATLRQVVGGHGVVVDPESVMRNLDDERRDVAVPVEAVP